MINEVMYMKKVLDKIELHVNCLSCTKIVTDSLMLTCGHNICNDVI